jgi:crotonobetainyl-CoA:carnitine CoA-transferase CaiB-like acyl-CoA transferase
VTAALLEGVRVLDFGIWRPVPYATQLMVEMGADVLKIEPPTGDPMRIFPELFAVLNAGKRSIAVDLKNADGVAEVLALAADADSVIEGFRPGVADRLGVGFEAVRAANPAVVYCSVSGYGADGPLAQMPGHDINYQAYAGVLRPRGGPPISGSLPVGDLGAGMTAAMATIAGCLKARATGEGERIDVSIADVLATWTGAVGKLTPVGSTLPMNGLPGYGTYRTADGQWVALGVLTEAPFWSGLCRALGLERLDGLDVGERIARKDELDSAVAVEIARRPGTDVVAALEKHDVPVSPVLDRREMLKLDHLRRRGTVIAHGELLGDERPVMGHPARYARHPARVPGRVPDVGDDPTRSWLAR